LWKKVEASHCPSDTVWFINIYYNHMIVFLLSHKSTNYLSDVVSGTNKVKIVREKLRRNSLLYKNMLEMTISYYPNNNNC
jgi:hypothetical protein